MMCRTVMTIAGVLSDEYFDFDSVKVPCPISRDDRGMEAARACIRTNTADPVTSFVRRVNFEFEIVENRGLFADKTKLFHRIVLVSNLEYTWRLELSVHCVSEVT